MDPTPHYIWASLGVVKDTTVALCQSKNKRTNGYYSICSDKIEND